MLAHTVENGTAAQPGTGTKVNPGHSWPVILMSVQSRALKGVISEYVTGSQGNHWPFLPQRHKHTSGSTSEPASHPRACHRVMFWNERAFSTSFRPCHMPELSYSYMASKNQARAS